MRIIVAGPPKTGNVWLKYLLAEIYQLKVLENPPADENEFKRAIETGWFEDNSIFHQHFAPRPDFLNLAESTGAKLVTIIRNPYDTFVSLYFFVQNFPQFYRTEKNPLNVLIGKPIDHPDVLEFIGNPQGFGVHIASALRWSDCGKSIIVKYEDLRSNPVLELKKITSQIGEVEDGILRRAIEQCSQDNMRKQFRKRNAKEHMRKGEVGDWQNHLTKAHLDIIRKTYPSFIGRLGYAVA